MDKEARTKRRSLLSQNTRGSQDPKALAYRIRNYEQQRLELEEEKMNSRSTGHQMTIMLDIARVEGKITALKELL